MPAGSTGSTSKRTVELITTRLTIALPVTDQKMLDDGKVGVYLLNWFWEDAGRQYIAHAWEMQDAVIDKNHKTATVEVTGCNQDVILGVFSDTYGPDALSPVLSGRSDKPSITLEMTASSDSGLKEITLKRERYLSPFSDPGYGKEHIDYGEYSTYRAINYLSVPL